jgi:hypothetical protein
MGRGGISIFYSSVGRASDCRSKGPEIDPWSRIFFLFFFTFSYLWGFFKGVGFSGKGRAGRGECREYGFDFCVMVP